MSAVREGQITFDEAGEITKPCPACPELAEELDRANMRLKGAERDINAWRIRYEELRRDKEADARGHELWDPAIDLFGLWRKAAALAEGRQKPKGSRFSGERFFLTLPFLKADGLELCERAVLGRCADHFCQQRANGRFVHYCEYERIFGDKGKGATPRSNFEESVLRAPRDWRRWLERLKTAESLASLCPQWQTRFRVVGN